MKIYKIYFLVVIFSISAHLYAKNIEYTWHCASKNYINDFENCLDKELAKYDKELNDLYRGILKRSPNEQLKKLRCCGSNLKRLIVRIWLRKFMTGHIINLYTKHALLTKQRLE